MRDELSRLISDAKKLMSRANKHKINDITYYEVKYKVTRYYGLCGAKMIRVYVSQHKTHDRLIGHGLKHFYFNTSLAKEVFICDIESFCSGAVVREIDKSEYFKCIGVDI